MILKSSSIHMLSADFGLNRWQRALWFALNKTNNAAPNVNVDSHLKIRPFVVSDPSSRVAHMTKSSPSRALSDLFWQVLPWDRIEAELGTLHVFDSGCGKGHYVTQWSNWSGDRIGSYVGFDINKRETWDTLQQQHPNTRFVAADSKMVEKVIPPDTNLFVSQSALEHFREDLTYFRQVRNFVQHTGRPTLQIHLLPSAETLRTYRLHGVRQYTPRTLSYITRLFTTFSDVFLFRLGGQHCNDLHYEFITNPLKTRHIDLRDTETTVYMTNLAEAIEKDMKHPTSSTNFYALVIHAYPSRSIFDSWL